MEVRYMYTFMVYSDEKGNLWSLTCPVIRRKAKLFSDDLIKGLVTTAGYTAQNNLYKEG